ncbi:MAG: hypothetical protein U0169_09155 [Polyangiaceae bacterium]
MKSSGGPSVRPKSVLSLVPFLAALVGCAGPYGYARTYAPTGEESKALEGSREFDPVMAEREPDAWRKGNVSLFGVVVARTDTASGEADLTVGLRRVEPRNLCESQASEDTCRVTVSEADFGVAHVLVKLASGDASGELSVGRSSLVRVVGQLAPEPDTTDKKPVVHASFYRHWPRGYFVTRAAAASMRQ